MAQSSPPYPENLIPNDAVLCNLKHEATAPRAGTPVCAEQKPEGAQPFSSLPRLTGAPRLSYLTHTLSLRH